MTNIFFEINSELFQIICIIFFASTFVHGMVIAESRKTNRRIDLLIQMLKQERKQKKIYYQLCSATKGGLFNSPHIVMRG